MMQLSDPIVGIMDEHWLVIQDRMGRNVHDSHKVGVGKLPIGLCVGLGHVNFRSGNSC